jgi:hypothetical protein
MTLSEAYEALLKLPQEKGCTQKNDTCLENGNTSFPCNPASEPAESVFPMSWQDYVKDMEPPRPNRLDFDDFY